ncbi:MAG: pyridoxal 5'-phosphate synthase glutaminase subunit PdxT [Planctomycetota bacterium]|nr:pyridoxal 5'-phosphate synthase glutaminase subunit PdxT [Planctomycetota bacterium]
MSATPVVVSDVDAVGPLTGVLALQGDFAEHEAALQRAQLPTRQIRSPRDLAGIKALVLPGGESTTMLRLLDIEGLWEPMSHAVHSGMPVFATCAGMILLAERVENPVQRSFGVLPITVVRNGYGRQLHSGTFLLRSEILPTGTTGTFIRAPRITHTGPECEVLAFRGDDPVLVQKGNVLAACFHPELVFSHVVIARFAAMVREQADCFTAAG